MKLTPETFLALTNLIRFGIDSLQAGAAGEKTEAEIWAEYDAMQDNVRRASERWRSQG